MQSLLICLSVLLATNTLYANKTSNDHVSPNVLSDVARKELNVKRHEATELSARVATVKIPGYNNEVNRQPTKFVQLSFSKTQAQGQTDYLNKNLNLSEKGSFTNLHLDISKNVNQFKIQRAWLGVSYGKIQTQFDVPIGSPDKALLHLTKIKGGLGWDLIKYKQWGVFTRVGLGQIYLTQVTENATDNKNTTESLALAQVGIKTKPFKNFRLITDITYFQDLKVSKLSTKNYEGRLGIEYGWY